MARWAAGLAAGAVLVAGLASACGLVSSTGSSAAGRSSEPAATPSASSTYGLVGALPAGRQFCGASTDVAEITLEKWSNGDFRVSLRPTDAGRHASDREAATATMWQDIVNCVHPPAGGIQLTGAVGASLRDQLACHEDLALLPSLHGGSGYATGPTYDIESWRPVAGESRWFSSECGNKLGTDPTSAPSAPYRPDGAKIQYSSTGEHE